MSLRKIGQCRRKCISLPSLQHLLSLIMHEEKARNKILQSLPSPSNAPKQRGKEGNFHGDASKEQEKT